VFVRNEKSAIDYFKLDKEEILGPHITYDPVGNSFKSYKHEGYFTYREL